MKDNQTPGVSHFIYNLISRTLPYSSSYGLPSIRPVVTPDMLPIRFRNWELGGKETDELGGKETDELGGKETDEQYQWRHDVNNNDFLSRPPSPISGSSLISPPADSDPSFTSTKTKEATGTKILGSQHRGEESQQHPDFSISYQMNSLIPYSSSSESSHLVDTPGIKQKMQQRTEPSDSQRTSLKGKERKLVEETTTTTTNLTIHIGRVEVRALLPKGSQQAVPLSTALPSQKSKSHLSLTDYLKQRSEGRY